MAFRRVEKIDIDSLVDVRSLTITTAQTALKQEQIKGFPKTGYLRLVDNRENKPEKDVKLYGKIEYIAPQQLLNIALEALDMLEKLSPVGKGSAANRTGRYWQNHLILFNRQIIEDGFALKQALNKNVPRDFTKDEIFVVNTQPYARKIERGHSPLAARGVYKPTANILKRKYGKIARIEHRMITYKKIPGLTKSLVTRYQKTKGGLPQRVTQIYPAIRIRPGRGARFV